MNHASDWSTGLGRQPTAVQIITFLGIAGVSVALFSILAWVIAAAYYHLNPVLEGSMTNLDDSNTVHALKFIQLFTSVGLFILPPLLFAFLMSKNRALYLSMNKKGQAGSYLMVILLMLVSLPAINWLAALNSAMSLPDFMRGIEQWMRHSEEQAMRITEAFLKMEDTGDFLFNILLIAIVPGIGEELLFRGVLQKLLIKWTGNQHAGIWIAAVLFSALHGQFFGFIPRMLLGAMFGYLLIWSGSLWYAVLGHIMNNGSAVILSYLSSRGEIPVEVETFGTSQTETWYSLASLATTLMLLFLIKRMWAGKNNAFH